MLLEIIKSMVDSVWDYEKYPRTKHVSTLELFDLSFGQTSHGTGIISHLRRCQVCQAAFEGISMSFHLDLTKLAQYSIPHYGPSQSDQEKELRATIAMHLEHCQVCRQTIDYLQGKNELFRYMVQREVPSALVEVQRHNYFMLEPGITMHAIMYYSMNS